LTVASTAAPAAQPGACRVCFRLNGRNDKQLRCPRSSRLVVRSLPLPSRRSSFFAGHWEFGLPGSRAVTLVTGGAGFIGSHLVERLLALGQRVRVVDNLSTGKLENLAPVISDIEFLRADLRDVDE